MAICQLCNVQLQKEVKSNSKPAQLLKSPQEDHCEKDMKSKVAAKKWLRWYRLTAKKIIITTIQVNLCCPINVSLGYDTKFTQIAVIKVFAILRYCQTT